MKKKKDNDDGSAQVVEPVVAAALGPAPVVLRREVEHLAVRLTDDELLERGQTLAQIEADLRAHEEHATGVKQGLKAEEARLLSEQCRLAGIVRRKSEDRPVEVKIRADRANRIACTFRTDTHQQIRQRPMTEEEMQGKLFADAGQEKAETKP